ncbi:MAG: hypothetical protein AB7P20_27225, partial [Rhizobiaceae bacterium]
MTIQGHVIERLAEAAESVGSVRFGRSLLALTRDLLPHDSYLTLKYFRHEAPKIDEEGGLADGLMQFYASGVYKDDPFYKVWINHASYGVLALARIEPNQDHPYFNLYLRPRAGITDEVGILLPSVGDSVLGVFVEKKKNSYKEREISRLARLYPLIFSLNRSHLNQLISRMRSIAEREFQGAGKSLLILDRQGKAIAADALWSDPNCDCPAFQALREMRSSNRASILLDDGRLLRRIKIVDDCGLGGALEAYCIEPRETASRQKTALTDSSELWSK